MKRRAVVLVAFTAFTGALAVDPAKPAAGRFDSKQQGDEKEWYGRRYWRDWGPWGYGRWHQWGGWSYRY